MSQETLHIMLTVLIVVAVLAAVAVVVYLVYRFRRKRTDAAYADRILRKKVYKQSITPAQQRLKRAQKEYDRRLQDRADAIRDAESAREKALRQQEREMRTIEDQYSAQIDDFNGIRLYRDRVEAKGKSVRLDRHMQASVMTGRQYLDASDVAAEKVRAEARVSLEDDATGVKVGTATVIDERATASAYLVIHDGEDPRTADIRMPLDDRDVEGARSFANIFNCAANDIDALREQKARQLGTAKAEAERIKADRSAIEAAQAAYEAETQVRDDLDKAQRTFNEAEYEARKRRDGIR